MADVFPFNIILRKQILLKYTYVKPEYDNFRIRSEKGPLKIIDGGAMYKKNHQN